MGAPVRSASFCGVRAAPRWLWLALGFVFVGVPVIACGGRALSERAADGGGDVDAGMSPGTGAGFGTSPSGPSGSSQASPGTGSGSATGSSGPGNFGPFPCTAYTAIYNDCPPSTARTGCQYLQEWGNPPQGINRVQGETAGPGCKIEIVPPTSTGGTTCDHVDCVCTGNGTWQNQLPTSGSPCP
jgi:hypothetical protein